MRNKLEKVETIFLYAVFSCYLLFLLKLLILSRASLISLLHNPGTLGRSVNLIPFYTIKEYIFSTSATIKSFAIANVVGNIVIFIPLGTYLLVFKHDKRVATNLLVIFIVSLFIEIIQGLLGIGASDIDDIILNGSGGLAGIAAYKLLLFILRDARRVRIAITILSAIGLPVLLYYLIVIRLRL